MQRLWACKTIILILAQLIRKTSVMGKGTNPQRTVPAHWPIRMHTKHLTRTRTRSWGHRARGLNIYGNFLAKATHL